MDVDPQVQAVLLVEYQKAQDSAEHHDDYVGAVTSLWLGSAILIGFVLSGLTAKQAADHKLVFYFVAALGIFVTLLAWSWAERASTLKAQKYSRCKDIEAILGMRQHSCVGPAKWWQPWAYRLLVVIFVAVWIVVVADVVSL
jgi:hypothetical protein